MSTKSEVFPAEPIKTVWTIDHGDPRKIEIYKETEKCIWVSKSWGSGFRRMDKPIMFDAKLDALRVRVARAEAEVRMAEASLERQKEQLLKRKEDFDAESANPTA